MSDINLIFLFITLLSLSMSLFLIFRLRNFHHLPELIQSKLSEKLLENHLGVTKEMNSTREHLQQSFIKSQDKAHQVVERVNERLVKIDLAQKNIQEISKDIQEIQSVLIDKKARGIFGETQLHYVLSVVFGERNQQVYALQAKLENGTICDCLIHQPAPSKPLVIDSKFPLENYRRSLDLELGEDKRLAAANQFKKDMKKHIQDVAGKYIDQGTAAHAIVFIPAEAIFSEIYAHYPEIVEYAHDKRIWLTSPNTLMAILTSILSVIRTHEHYQNSELLQKEMRKLSKDFKVFHEQWEKYWSRMELLHKDSDVLTKKYQHIQRDLDKIENVNL